MCVGGQSGFINNMYYLLVCGLCALCFLVVSIPVRVGGGSALNSRNKVTLGAGGNKAS